MRPSSRASRIEVGQIQLAGRGRRREGRDPAAQPRGVEGIQPGVDLVARQLLVRGVACLDDPFDGPELAAHDAPELGRIGGEDTGQRDRGIVLAPRLEDGIEVGTGHQRHVTGQDQDLGRLVGHDAESRPDRVAGAARLVLEREDRTIGEDIDEGGDRWREDHDGASTRRAVLRCSPRRRGRTPASGRPHSAWRTLGVADFIRVPRPAASTTAAVPLIESGLGGFTRGRAVGRRSSGGCRARTERNPARSSQQSSVGRGIVGVARRGCQPTRATTSISTRAPFGRAATPTVERAGGGSVTNRP